MMIPGILISNINLAPLAAARPAAQTGERPFSAVIGGKLYSSYKKNIELDKYNAAFDPVTAAGAREKNSNCMADWFHQGWLLYSSTKA